MVLNFKVGVCYGLNLANMTILTLKSLQITNKSKTLHKIVKKLNT